MKNFQPVRYQKLNAKQKELFNFHKIAATLVDYGFNCLKLSDDWQGADFLAYHFDGETTLKVQLKARITIGKKYCEKDLWIAFPHKNSWYLVQHDDLIEKIGRDTDWLKTKSWLEEGGYSAGGVNKKLLESLKDNKLDPVYGPELIEKDSPDASNQS